jgi:hypothetical protein
MIRLALAVGVVLTFAVMPLKAPTSPTAEPSDCPYLRITVEERPAPSPVAEPPRVEVNAFAGCMFGNERTMTLCALDATGADHGCVRSAGPKPERASFGLHAICTVTGAGVVPYRIEVTITDATGLVRRSSIPLDTAIAC